MPIRNVQCCKPHTHSSCTFGKYYPLSRTFLGGKIMSPGLNLDPDPCSWKSKFLLRFLDPGVSSCGGSVANVFLFFSTWYICEKSV